MERNNRVDDTFWYSSELHITISSRLEIKPSMLGRAAQLGGTNWAWAADWTAWLNWAKPERQGYAAKQAEPSMYSHWAESSRLSARFSCSVSHTNTYQCAFLHTLCVLHTCSSNQKPAMHGVAWQDTLAAGVLGHSLANQKPGMHSGAFCSVHLAAPSMFNQAQAALLLSSVWPNRAQAPIPHAWPNQAKYKRQGCATEQAELSTNQTETSPSWGSAWFAWFDSRPYIRIVLL